LFHKTPEAGKSNVQGQGATYAEAVAAVRNDFGIDTDTFNQTVLVQRVYAITLEEQKKIQMSKPVSAGPVDEGSTTIENYV
jgi:hypothetical protein